MRCTLQLSANPATGRICKTGRSRRSDRLGRAVERWVAERNDLTGSQKTAKSNAAFRGLVTLNNSTEGSNAIRQTLLSESDRCAAEGRQRRGMRKLGHTHTAVLDAATRPHVLYRATDFHLLIDYTGDAGYKTVRVSSLGVCCVPSRFASRMVGVSRNLLARRWLKGRQTLSVATVHPHACVCRAERTDAVPSRVSKCASQRRPSWNRLVEMQIGFGWALLGGRWRANPCALERIACRPVAACCDIQLDKGVTAEKAPLGRRRATAACSGRLRRSTAAPSFEGPLSAVTDASSTVEKG